LKQDFKKISSQIVNWYLQDGRHHLPWRKKVTPYRIWISEIMLQQTQVKTVIPYFNAFMKKYPTLQKLSSASEDEILAAWSGLGFYRRAKNIFAAKETIKKDYKNKFPNKFESIIDLPGIGRSTAGALMSLAFLVPQPILDGNVKRVISRLIRKKISSLKEKDMWDLSKKLVNTEDCFSYTQGIMDIGATVCTKANPSCQVCPLNEDCMSAFNVEVEVKNNNKKPKKIMMMAFAIVQTEQSFLFRKNEMNSIWSSLWLPFDQLAMKSYMKELKLTQNEKFRHELTHRSLDLNVNVYFSSKEFDLDTNQKYEWIKKDRIDDYGMPKPITKLIQQL
jgi:A/G-specific adenine glycosylase